MNLHITVVRRFNDILKPVTIKTDAPVINGSLLNPFIVAYVMFRVIYSLMFTFTVLRAILGVALEDDAVQLSGLTEFQKRKYKESRVLTSKIDDFRQNELLRQAELVRNMQGACSNYIEEIFGAILHEVNNATYSTTYEQMYGSHTSMSAHMNKWVGVKVANYEQRIARFTVGFQRNFSHTLIPAVHSMKRYLHDIYSSDWFQFLLLLFNETEVKHHIHRKQYMQ